MNENDEGRRRKERKEESYKTMGKEKLMSVDLQGEKERFISLCLIAVRESEYSPSLLLLRTSVSYFTSISLFRIKIFSTSWEDLLIGI